MPILGKLVGKNRINKFYLEQALFAYSINKPKGYSKICNMINRILNLIVHEEVRYGVYNERVNLSQETYAQIFG